MPRLLIKTPDGREITVVLSTKPIKLGRADWCDFVLKNDAEVSREHAEIWVDDQGRVMVADMVSKNGTRVDDGDLFKGQRRVAYHSIRIGEHEIRVLEAPAAPRFASERVEFQPDTATVHGDTQVFPSTRKFDLSHQRLALLISLTERIGGVFDRKQLLEQALDACCEALHFERGLIVLKSQRGATEHPVTRNVARDETGAYKVSRTLINRALRDGERTIVNNPATDLIHNLSESLVRFPIQSALSVPIMNRGEILGVIYGDRITRNDAQPYQPEDVDFLAAIAQQVGVGLVNLRLLQDHLSAQRLYAELQQARIIQRRLFPSAPIRRGRICIDGYNEASSTVSGDYFDFFELDDGRLGMIIADVTGHGLPAALLMANLQSAMRVAMNSRITIPELTARLNRLIHRNTDSNVFITAAIGVIDPDSGRVEFVSAGHPSPLLIRPREVQPLPEELNALPLGIETDEAFVPHVLQLDSSRPGLLFYTDGLVEALDRDGSQLGLRPVVNELAELPSITADNMLKVARTSVRRHLDGIAPADDMTLLAISFHA